MILITSRDNPKIERWKKLKEKNSFRREQGAVLIEGNNLICDLLQKMAHQVRHIIVREGCSFETEGQFNITYLSKGLFRELSSIEESHGIIAEIAIPNYGTLSEFLLREKKSLRLLILDSLQDPGNVGTLIRTSFAFHIDAVLSIQPMCDFWNPKVVRAGKGAHFYLPLFETNWEEIANCIEKGLFPDLVGAFPIGNGAKAITNYSEKEFFERRGWALILGNEARGAQIPSCLPITKATIPMNSTLDSLNVAQAGAILLFTLSQKTLFLHN